MTVRLNPIVKKDVRVQSRSMKICWGVFAYDAILALVFFLAMAIIRQEIRYSDGNVYGAMVWLYPILGVTQLVILGVVVPVRTASSISGEKERQTFDIMMTTGMTPFSVILGKVMTAIVQSMFFVVASMPIMALCFTIGGMSWSYLFWFLAVAFLVSFFAASIGILCSSICRKSISAVIMSYGFYLLFFLGTVLPSILYQIFYINLSYSSYYNGWGNTPLFLLLNPFIYLSEFFAQVMVGRSVVSELFGGGMSGAILGQVATGYRWVVVSSVLFVSVSVLFLLAAARRIDPVRNYGGKRKRQKSAG
jgi:ABC-type transport system involved in multi-copper enzyme maturation permease subunit